MTLVLHHREPTLSFTLEVLSLNHATPGELSASLSYTELSAPYL